MNINSNENSPSYSDKNNSREVTLSSEVEIQTNVIEDILKHCETFIFEKKLDGSFSYLSPQIAKTLGFSIEKVKLALQNVMSDKSINTNNYTNVNYSSSSLEVYEIELKSNEEKSNWFEIREAIAIKKDNEPTIVGAAINITKKKSSEKALAKSEENYRLLVENQTELIVKFDLSGKITFVSPNYFKTFKINEDQVIGKRFMPDVHPEDILGIQNELKRALQEPYDCQHTERMRTNKGWRWFSWRNRGIIKEDGKVEEIISVGRDITERIEDHQEIKKLSLIAQETNNAVIITDKDTKIEWVNKAFSKITGYLSDEVVGLKPGPFLQGEETDKNTILGIKNAINAGRQIKTELINYSKEGKKYWIELNIQPIHNSKGEIEKFISIESDITERKKTEEYIKLTQARLKEAQRIAKIGNWDWDIVNKTIWCSDQTYDLFGLETNTIDYKIFMNFVRDDYKRFVSEKMNNALEKHENYEVEYPIIRKDGKELFIYSYGKVFYDKDNKPIRMAGVSQDITARKVAEEELRQSEEGYRTIFESTPNGILIIDRKLNIIDANPTACKMYEYTLNEMKLLSISDLSSNITAEQNAPKVTEIIDNDVCYDFEAIDLKKGGLEFITNVSLSSIKYRGETYILEIVTDITKRKNAEEALKLSEEKFSKAFFTTPDALIITTFKEGKIIEVNEGFEKIFGYNKKEVLDKSLHGIGMWKNPKRRFEAIEILERDGKIRNEEGWFVAKNGKEGFGDLSVDVIYLDNRRCLLSIVKDITERKRAETKIQNYQNNLKLLTNQITIAEQEERRRIAINLHDNIGQSLAMSKIKLSEAERECQNSTVLEKLKIAKKHLDKSIDSSRSITYELSPPILYELGFTAAVRWRLEQVEQEHSIKTSLIDNAKDVKLSEDANVLLFRVALEIITNTVKHAKATKLNILISKIEDIIEIKFIDNGIGFDPVLAEKKAVKTNSIGLFSLKERISYINGTIKINSIIEKGTTSIIKIPYPKS